MPHSKSPHDYPEEFWKLAKLLAATAKHEVVLHHQHAANFRHRWYAFLKALQESQAIDYGVLRDQAFKFKCVAEDTTLRFIDKAFEMRNLTS